MGTHGSSNIKLLRRGTSSVRAIGGASEIPVVVSPRSVPLSNSTFPADILAQPLGKTGMINRLYDTYFPKDSVATQFSHSLSEKIDVDRMLTYPPLSDRYSGELDDGRKFDAANFLLFHGNIGGIMDKYWDEPNFGHNSSPVGRILNGKFGKYTLALNQRGDTIILRIFDGRNGRLMAEFTNQAKFPLRYHIFDATLQSKVDARLAQLLEYALISNQTLFQNILELMK
jgi:hypothetical protein